MALDTLLNRKQSNSVTSVTSCNVGDVTPKPACIKDVTLVTSVTSQTINSQLEKIRTWLFKIGEPESDHYLVIDKCKTNPEAMAYFLRHVNGEFEGYAATDDRQPDDRVRCGDCLYLSGEYCQKYHITNHGIKYRLEQNNAKAVQRVQAKIGGCRPMTSLTTFSRD